jgi:hypothetical protein
MKTICLQVIPSALTSPGLPPVTLLFPLMQVSRALAD